METTAPVQCAEVSRLVKQARLENHLAIRAMKRIKNNGLLGYSLQEVAMPRFVRNNLMKLARKLRAA